MEMKRVGQCMFLWMGFLLGAMPAQSQNVLGQTLQISTNFHSIAGTPTWLLIIRDVTNGQVLPYVFDIKNNDNFWVAFTYGHSYRVNVSTLKFGPFAKLKNFCKLEKGILTGQSMFITLTGNLTPDLKSFNCHVTTYRDASFHIVTDQPGDQG